MFYVVCIDLLSVLLYYHHQPKTILLLNLSLKITKLPKTLYRPKERGPYIPYPARDKFSELWRSVLIILVMTSSVVIIALHGLRQKTSCTIVYLSAMHSVPCHQGYIYSAKPRRPFTSPMLLPKVRYFCLKLYQCNKRSVRDVNNAPWHL